MNTTIAIVLTARASFAKLETIIEHLPPESVTLYACGQALLPRYGEVIRVVTRRFPTVRVVEVWSHLEGSTPVTSAKSAGALVSELSGHFQRDRPRVVLVMADRSEVLAAAQAASYMGIPLAHVQGGERTGSIDDKVRDAVTQLADYHFPSTKIASLRLHTLGCLNGSVYLTGCPSIDLAKRALADPPVGRDELSGSGSDISPHERFALVIQHSDTDVWEESFQQMRTTLDAVADAKIPMLVQYGNADAGAERMHKAIRLWKDHHQDQAIRTIPNLPPQRFLRLMTQATVLVGNSSAFVREASYLGVPAVIVGDRQRGRERGPNAIDVGYGREAITQAIHQQIRHGPYPRSTLYGDGSAGARIAAILTSLADREREASDVSDARGRS